MATETAEPVRSSRSGLMHGRHTQAVCMFVLRLGSMASLPDDEIATLGYGTRRNRPASVTAQLRQMKVCDALQVGSAEPTSTNAGYQCSRHRST